METICDLSVKCTVRSGTDFISLLILFLLFFSYLLRALQKSLRLRRFKSEPDEILQECSSRRIFDLTSHYQDGGHDVISPNTVLPPSEWTRSVYRLLCSSVRQFLIYVRRPTWFLADESSSASLSSSERIHCGHVTPRKCTFLRAENRTLKYAAIIFLSNHTPAFLASVTTGVEHLYTAGYDVYNGDAALV